MVACTRALLHDPAYANLSDDLVLNPSLQKFLLFQVPPDRPILIKGGSDEERRLVVEAVVEKFRSLNWPYLRFNDQGYEGSAASRVPMKPSRTTFETFANLSEHYANPGRATPPTIDLITLEHRLDMLAPNEMIGLSSMNYLYASAHRLLTSRDVALPWILIPFPNHLVAEEPTLSRILLLSAYVVDLDGPVP